MKLDDIGFYTLSDARVKNVSLTSPLWRCEMILTGRCNFRCPYCRSVGGEDLPLEQARKTLSFWIHNGLKNVRFSGGEPTLYPGLHELVVDAAAGGVERIALSTNGSAPTDFYLQLLASGVNDFSISLDACCSEDGDRMAGGRKGAFEKVEHNIRELAKRTYVTVGVVLTQDNEDSVSEIIKFADRLGVSDIRVIPAAQHGERLPQVEVSQLLLNKYPILRYRIGKLNEGARVRGLDPTDNHVCGLVVDDMAVMGTKHYPCIIYLRENGKPIGDINSRMVRYDRLMWSKYHDPHSDPICQKNCLDVCVDYNKKYERRG